MAIENPGSDWCIPGPLRIDGRYRRGNFVAAELRDFNRDVGIVISNSHPVGGTPIAFALQRDNAQELFDKLWEFGFRPTMKDA